MGHPSPRPVATPPEPASSSGLRLKDLTPPPAVPFFLGRYLVVDEIGRGGMASVHLARLDGPGGFHRWVAIKRIHPHLVENEQFVDMFLDEARTAAGISHANVVQVFELGKDEDSYWLAMEYLHGEPLGDVIRRAAAHRARIHPALAARIGADAAEGLHAAHELRRRDGSPLGLVHRDVSPHNLFVTYDGHTKVVDFGIAKGADRLSAETGAGILKGKIAYMSPEQVHRGVVDRTTDVFALGVVLWEMTTGRRLFRADTDLETLTNVMDGVVPRPSAIVPGYPPELEACVMRALARSKADRYPTARDLARALSQYLVRSGQLVGVQEVADLVRGLFGDRIEARAAHLAWASEVTVSEPLARPRGATRSPVLAAGAPARESRRPAPPALSPEDEDVPTVVARWSPPSRPSLAAGGSAAPPVVSAAPAVDLGATVALPASFASPPSPAFRMPEPGLPAPFAPILAPPVLAMEPRPAPAAPSGGRLAAAALVSLLLLALLGVLGMLAVGVLVARAARAPATNAVPAR